MVVASYVPFSSPPARRGRPRKSAEQRNENLRRADVLREAARLFRRQGFDGTSTRDIAVAAGMQSGSLFYYFKSKRALLAAVIQNGMEDAIVRQTQMLQALDADVVSPSEQLRALIRQHLQGCLNKGSDFIPVMLYEWHKLSPAQRNAVAHQKDVYEGAWMPALKALQETGELRADPRMARLLIFGALNWTVQWFKHKGALSLDELAMQAAQLFIGAASEGSAAAYSRPSTNHHS